MNKIQPFWCIDVHMIAFRLTFSKIYRGCRPNFGIIKGSQRCVNPAAPVKYGREKRSMCSIITWKPIRSIKKKAACTQSKWLLFAIRTDAAQSKQIGGIDSYWSQSVTNVHIHVFESVPKRPARWHCWQNNSTRRRHHSFLWFPSPPFLLLPGKEEGRAGGRGEEAVLPSCAILPDAPAVLFFCFLFLNFYSLFLSLCVSFCWFCSRFFRRDCWQKNLGGSRRSALVLPSGVMIFSTLCCHTIIKNRSASFSDNQSNLGFVQVGSLEMAPKLFQPYFQILSERMTLWATIPSSSLTFYGFVSLLWPRVECHLAVIFKALIISESIVLRPYWELGRGLGRWVSSLSFSERLNLVHYSVAA